MLTLLCLIALYFLPTIIASQRGLRAGGAGILNALFGWTGVGWIALLVWAIVAQPVYCHPAVWAYGPYRRW